MKLSCATGLCATLAAVLLAGCATSSTGAGTSTAAPANYKQAVAVKMRELVDVGTVRSAEITRPHERFMGLILGGTRTVVCVNAVHLNFLGMEVAHPYIFYFNNGRADGYKQGTTGPMSAAFIGCPGEQFSPFPELRAR